jgi:hypothetical protein
VLEDIPYNGNLSLEKTKRKPQQKETTRIQTEEGFKQQKSSIFDLQP